MRNLQPMVMEPSACRSITHHFLQHVRAGHALPTPAVIEEREKQLRTEMGTRIDSGEIVILPIRGIIEHRMSIWGWLFGGTSCEAFSVAFQAAVDDSTVKKIVFDCDSPGGTYPGIPELATQIFSQRDAKGANGIVAVSNPQCSSGAMWLCSAAQKLFVIGSGMAGSIGCYSLHTEYSKMDEMDGVTNTVFRDPEGKAGWNPWEPLPDEEKKIEQQRVSEITDEFQAAVAKHRGVSKSKVEKEFGNGREMPAKECVSVGMCDGIKTLEQVLGRAAKKQGRRTEEVQNRRLRMKI
jgi:ClpP class serine protease